MLLSLCMIVRDEEENLPRCLQSVKGLADEIIVADTGSKDRTAEIASRFGAKFFHIPWNDSFADARNESIAKANGEWILLMDADDRLEDGGAEKILRLLRASRNDCDIFCCRTVCFVGESADGSACSVNQSIRLIRNGRGYRFRGRIHEQVVQGEKSLPVQAFRQADVTFYHYGYLDRQIRQKNKHARNLRLIRMELNENPLDAFMLFCMGNEFLAMSQPYKALCCFRRSHLLADLRDSYTPVLLLRMIVCCDRLKLDRELSALVTEGLNRFPLQAPDFLYLKACALHRRGDPRAALRYFRKCVSAGKSPFLCCSIPGSASYQAEYSQAVVLAKLGETEKAIRRCLKAARAWPAFRPAYQKAVDLMAEAGYPAQKIAERMSRSAPHGSGPAWILAEIFFGRRMYRQALSACLRAERGASGGARGLFLKGACSFYLCRFRSAAKILARIPEEEKSHEAAWLLLLCSLFGSGRLPTKDRRTLLTEPELRTAEGWLRTMNGELCGPFGFGSPEPDGCPYADPVFAILESLLACGQVLLFEESLPLLDLLDCRGKFLRLGKLYYQYGFPAMAWEQILLSIQLTGEIDAQGLDILRACCPPGRHGGG